MHVCLGPFKHAQQRELEHLKFEINASMDRAAKLHQREFEILPVSWAKLSKACHVVRAFVSPLQSYADVKRMSQRELNDHLAETGFSIADQDLVREANDERREALYRDVTFRFKYSEVHKLCVDHNIDLDTNGIFMRPGLKELFQQLSALVWEALTEHRLNYDTDMMPRQRTKYDALEKQGATLRDQLEESVRQRLWSGVYSTAVADQSVKTKQ